MLRQARDGSLPGMVKTRKTFADAADEWLTYCENVCVCKLSAMRDYRNMVRVLDREFGKRKIETITTEDIDLWVSGYGGSNRTRQKYLVCLGSIFKRAMKVYGLPERGQHLGYKSFKERYRAALRAAGLREDFRFHNLRHTFGLPSE